MLASSSRLFSPLGKLLYNSSSDNNLLLFVLGLDQGVHQGSPHSHSRAHDRERRHRRAECEASGHDDHDALDGVPNRVLYITKVDGRKRRMHRRPRADVGSSNSAGSRGLSVPSEGYTAICLGRAGGNKRYFFSPL